MFLVVEDEPVVVNTVPSPTKIQDTRVESPSEHVEHVLLPVTAHSLIVEIFPMHVDINKVLSSNRDARKEADQHVREPSPMLVKDT